jgi:Protein kinase domain
MTEETIFAEALEKSTPIDRIAYLDKACAGDTVLRQRIETLLKSHEAEGNFLGKPAIQCAAEEWAGQACAGDTQGELSADDGGVEALDFLGHSDKPGALGRLGHYEVLEVIGRGGMGIVLRAVDEKLQRVVAIKVMAAQLATNATARKRFTREAQAAAAVTHDHIVTIHAVEEANGLPYLVMQYVSGASLQERLDRSGPLELREIVRIGMQTAAGLAAAHAHGLIHRDIKPANILLENGVERVRITDFGLARAVADASLTQSGVVAGTPQYMSPEQARGEAVDQRTDLFSLGSVLYAMCTGRPPFRADSGMAVLKRVCDDTPSAIRETNPDLPDWLVAIVTKLHAKNPADRFQSATEVADLLRDHLAHLQHPSVVGPVAGYVASPSGNGPGVEGAAGQPAPRRRRWTMAAAALLLSLIAGLGFTEATGVTSLQATVIRIFTPDGTLVVEVDDPGVKVTIEGDGGLVITGAGPHEVRLRPGSYKIQADKDGKRVPLERELVSITKNGREVVRVKLEAPPAPVAVTSDKGAFVLLAAGRERKFDTLPEAVQGANNGDTIEVRGNGPFVIDRIDFKQALTIRAGTGFRPVITDTPQTPGPDGGDMLTAHAPLRLEGLELRCTSRAYTILGGRGPLAVANCRFLIQTEGTICLASSAGGVVRNCELSSARGAALAFLGDPDHDNAVVHGVGQQRGAALAFLGDPDMTLAIANCLLVGHNNIEDNNVTRGATVRFTGNTFVTTALPTAFLHIMYMTRGHVPQPPSKQIGVFVADNVFDTERVVFDLLQPSGFKPFLTVAEAENWLPRRVEWREERNLYRAGNRLLGFEIQAGPEVETNRGKDLADWTRFWGLKDTGSLQGDIRFDGGDLRARARTDAAKITPEDFRLRPDSAGYRAGKDGKDLGADVDLVGPGKAYERWKETPEYQQWLKDTGQAKK